MVVGGPGPLTGRVSTGIPWKVGRVMPGSATSAIATRSRGVTSSTGASPVAVGSFTGSVVSIIGWWACARTPRSTFGYAVRGSGGTWWPWDINVGEEETDEDGDVDNVHQKVGFC